MISLKLVTASRIYESYDAKYQIVILGRPSGLFKGDFNIFVKATDWLTAETVAKDAIQIILNDARTKSAFVADRVSLRNHRDSDDNYYEIYLDFDSNLIPCPNNVISFGLKDLAVNSDQSLGVAKGVSLAISKVVAAMDGSISIRP